MVTRKLPGNGIQIIGLADLRTAAMVLAIKRIADAYYFLGI